MAENPGTPTGNPSVTSPVGAHVDAAGVSFGVWAPRVERARAVVVDENGQTAATVELTRQSEGHYRGRGDGLRAGCLYFYELDDPAGRYPDPASRFQPAGVHGPSEVIDPASFAWQDGDWGGVRLPGQVLYELHVGTFTREGTWRAAIERLAHLRDLGVTLLEVMPVADFAGDFGWGYDGVCWYAPTRRYGRPDDFRAFVDAAHRIGLGVILDVVYNHFGPTGNYSAAFSPYYLSQRKGNDWGDALNFDGEHSEPVRDFVAENAAYWIRDFHLDGLRLDATQAMVDDSSEHVLAKLVRAARTAAGERSIVIFAENEERLVRHIEPPESGGYGLDGLWNDDFHHCCRVAATGHAEFYYGDYSGTPQELISAMRRGFLFQGQWNVRTQTFRGTPTCGRSAARFVHFLQNHDQVANSSRGLRMPLLTSPGRYRALTALLLLGPQTPMLFMGQEFAASAPFLYFADHEVDVAALVRAGRWEFLRGFPRVADFGAAGGLADPSSRATFEASKIDWREAESHGPHLRLHRDLLRLRRDDPVFSRQDAQAMDGAVASDEALVLRWFGGGGDDRLLFVNLGRDQQLRTSAEPLLAAPAGRQWTILWSSERPQYGGSGTALLDTRNWILPGHAGIVLQAAVMQ